ncbi:MAG TPA: type II toxin-antitoxin system VapC family toxin [Chloroflexota bacterium]|nr:type II toxin-antitoxin system VapC family toxin [Chloroflexota bacterium]HUM70443.1 type II toxin-antitoxin system VapC family toxin [Chloroflexota bacterium]
MNLLLDTHTFLWSVNGGPLSAAVRDAFLDPENTLFLSMVSYWEICVKVGIGKLVLAENWAEQFDAEIAANGIRWLPIEPEHCRKILELPPIHQDPFDRLLIAQAICEKMQIATADRYFSGYPVVVIW